MKTNIPPYLLFTVFILFSCQKLEFEHIIKIVSLPAADVTSTTATLRGNIIDPGENITECGHVWWISGSSVELKITNAAKTGNFSNALTGLQSATKYLFKAYAIDRNGTVFGDTLDFTTAGISPVAAFTGTPTTLSAGNSVQFDDQSTNTPTAWSWNFGDGGTSTLQNPSHTYLIAGTYTVALTASNSFGSDDEIKSDYIIVAEGTEIFTDSRDGNSYYWVQIGAQVWMAENLAYLPSVSSSLSGSGTAQYFYVYGYEGASVSEAKATANYTTYGVLYNWPAAMNGASSSVSNPSGVQGVCPDGWHLPSNAEWTQLTNYLGGESVAGGKLKEAGYDHWINPNLGATNSSGFTALPGGYRFSDGSFPNVGFNGFWWLATEFDATYAWDRTLVYNSAYVNRGNYYKEDGFSVRCVRDY
jgi:uncharacterized protein (TIGR02145 family)